MGKIKEQVIGGVRSDFSVQLDGILYLGPSRLCVPSGEVRKQLLVEAHRSPYSVHPGGTKMYKDLKGNFWWPGMKKEVAAFVSRCLVCQQVKTERQRPA